MPPCFHVPQLKHTPESAPLGETPIVANQQELQPIAILQRKLIKRHNQPLLQLLIHW